MRGVSTAVAMTKKRKKKNKDKKMYTFKVPHKARSNAKHKLKWIEKGKRQKLPHPYIPSMLTDVPLF